MSKIKFPIRGELVCLSSEDIITLNRNRGIYVIEKKRIKVFKPVMEWFIKNDCVGQIDTTHWKIDIEKIKECCLVEVIE